VGFWMWSWIFFGSNRNVAISVLHPITNKNATHFSAAFKKYFSKTQREFKWEL
jgi:hypothetical protein